MSPALTVAVLGAGVVGRTLATGWSRAGHRVLLRSRSPSAPRHGEVLAATGAAAVVAHADAARQADVVVVTVPGDQVDDLVEGLGEALRARVVVDATNGAGTPMHHVERLRRAGATAYRALNSTGWEQMAAPHFGDLVADMPYAGPDGPTRADVERLLADLDFRPVWLGDDDDALALTDALARLWFRLVFGQGWGRRLGIRLLTAADDA